MSQKPEAKKKVGSSNFLAKLVTLLTPVDEIPASARQKLFKKERSSPSRTQTQSDQTE